MKMLMVVGGVILVTGFVVYALTASMAPGEFPDYDAGVSGALGRGAVGQVRDPVKVWTRPRAPAMRKEREEMLVGTLESGDAFKVLNHHRGKGQFWVQIVKRDDASFKGWMHSPAADPIHAKKLN